VCVSDVIHIAFSNLCPGAQWEEPDVLKIALFLFSAQGAGASEVAGGGPLTERSKTLGPESRPMRSRRPRTRRGQVRLYEARRAICTQGRAVLISR